MPSLSFQARPEVGFALSRTICCKKKKKKNMGNLFNSFEIRSWELGVARIFSHSMQELGT